MTDTAPGPKMPDLPPETDLAPASPASQGKKPPARPRWVTAFAIAVVVLVVLFLALHFSGVVPMHG